MLTLIWSGGNLNLKDEKLKFLCIIEREIVWKRRGLVKSGRKSAKIGFLCDLTLPAA